jgi:hypothetical protein
MNCMVRRLLLMLPPDVVLGVIASVNATYGGWAIGIAQTCNRAALLRSMPPGASVPV